MQEMVQHVYVNTLLVTVAAEKGFVRTLRWTIDHGHGEFSIFDR